jgi:transcriptional repressor NrdR
MKCPVCSCQDSRVLDSRPVDDGASIRRRRECPACGKRFTTYEVIDNVPIAVVKRDGHREFFDKHKLARGIQIACQKRPVNADAIATSIEQELMNSVETEISSTAIGEKVLSKLRQCDIVAYIRFASIYRDFKDIDSFTAELKGLSGEEARKENSEEQND